MSQGRLAVLLTALGVPAAAWLLFPELIATNRPLAVGSVLGLWMLIAVGGIGRGAIATAVRGRMRQAVNAGDLALGRRMTFYGKRYRGFLNAFLRADDGRGLATVGPHALELKEIYIDVSLVVRPAHEASNALLAGAPETTGRRKVSDFLHLPSASALAVIGGPGSGKTTLLRHVVLTSIAAGRRCRRPVAVLLTLRDHAARIATEPDETLPSLMDKTMAPSIGPEPPGWWRRKLATGRCTVLLDGLDEIAAVSDRRRVTDWIERQLALFPRNDFVVTSRPKGYRDAPLRSVSVLQVRPFTPEQVDSFLHGWYRATERRAAGHPAHQHSRQFAREIELRAREGAADLLDRLRQTPALYDLTTNPLLLTMVANVHRYRGALPASRADLYSEICQVMLWRRQEAKKLLGDDLTGPARERVLAHLAFAMRVNNISDISRDRLIKVIAPMLQRLAATMTPEEFLEHVGDNGLLVEREREVFAFAHQTFGEYLAARHIRDTNQQAVLIAAVDNVWWRETTLLYAATADATPIVQACLDSGNFTAIALAFDCVDNGCELSPDVRAKLESILSDGFDPLASSAHRELVSGVLATRYARQAGRGAGSPLPASLVASDLYRLFLLDTGVPEPVGGLPVLGGAPASVRGVWASDALRFVDWFNGVIGEGTAFRLPARDEVSSNTTPAFWTDGGSTSSGRLVPAGGVDAYSVAPSQIRTALMADTADFEFQRCAVLASTMMASAELQVSIGWSLARSRGVEFLPQLDLPRAREVVRRLETRALMGGLSSANDPLHYYVSRAHPEASPANLLQARRTMLQFLKEVLATGTVKGLSDLDRLLDSRLAYAFAFDRLRDHGLLLDMLPSLDLEFDLSPYLHADPGLVSEIVDLCAEESFVDEATRTPRKDCVALGVGVAVSRMVSAAVGPSISDLIVVGFGDEAVRVDPESLADRLGHACAALSGSRERAWSAVVARRLAQNAVAIFSRLCKATPGDLTAIRLSALALAVEAKDKAHVDTFREAAAATIIWESWLTDPDFGEGVVLTRT